MRKFLGLILPLVLLLGSLPAAAQNNSIKKLENQRAQLEKEIAVLNQQLNQNSRNSTKALSNLTLVRSKITTREKLIAQCDETLRVLGDSIKVCQAQLDLLQARHDTLALYYGRLIRGAYKNRDSRMWYMYVLGSESLGQGLRRAGYLRELSANMSKQAVKIRETAAELEVEKERLSGLKEEAEAVRRKVVNERAQLKNEEAEADRLVGQLQKDRKQYEKDLKNKNKQKQEINRKIEALIREQARKDSQKKKNNKKTTSTEVDAKLSKEFAANKGRLPWPVEGSVVESFGKHQHPVFKNVELPQNNGVTLAVKPGAQVKAIFEGTVSQVVVLPGLNQCVLVNHGDYYTLYARLRSVAVKPGEKIKIGQVVGIVDTISGEDLFHFELWKKDTPQNPENWLRK